MNTLKLNSKLKKLSVKHANDHEFGASVRLKFGDFEIVKNISNDFELGKAIRSKLHKSN